MLYVVAALSITCDSSAASIELQPAVIFCLDQEGGCVFNDQQHWRLTANSRYSFLGCWLVFCLDNNEELVLNAENKIKTKELFIAKARLSEQDYARVVRAIAYQQYHFIEQKVS